MSNAALSFARSSSDSYFFKAFFLAVRIESYPRRSLLLSRDRSQGLLPSSIYLLGRPLLYLFHRWFQVDLPLSRNQESLYREGHLLFRLDSLQLNSATGSIVIIVIFIDGIPLLFTFCMVINCIVAVLIINSRVMLIYEIWRKVAVA